MRKLILIAGFVLASATAYADEPRSLSTNSVDTPPAAAPAVPAETTKTVQAPAVAEEPKAAETPKYVERPTLVEPKTEPSKVDQPKTEQTKAAPSDIQSDKPVAKTASAQRNDRPRRQRYWTEGRIIGELHRYGIYW